MNDETKRSRMRAGVIGASVAVAAVGAIVVVATNKDTDEEERVSSMSNSESKRDALGPPRGEPVVDVTPPSLKWEREPTNVEDTTKPVDRTGGILGSTALAQGGAFASLTGTGDFSSGFDDNIYGGMLGNDQPAGGFGFGKTGIRPGGGGTGWGTIGTGRYGTISGGGGTGTGYGVGGSRRPRADAPVTLAQPNVVAVQGDGSLDKAIVRRYLKRNLAKLSYCYEKQLLAKPQLAGTLQIQFKILDTGRVIAGTATGVDPDVAGCVGSVVSSIEFPKPKGSGGVQVNVSLTVRPK